jgi:hypothetical protein
MSRTIYLLGWGFVAIAAAVAFRASRPEIYMPAPRVTAVPTVIPLAPAPIEPAPFIEPGGVVEPPVRGDDAAAWFDSVRPHCNALEVELTLQGTPPPAGWEGSSYAASCWAVAGRVERARELLLELPAEQRYAGASIVFNIGHPIADAGDDRSAGPIMQLVVEFQPNNYMALYHAGMSYYAVGENTLAKRHLQEFLRQYDVQDGWRSNALEVLERLRGEKTP